MNGFTFEEHLCIFQDTPVPLAMRRRIQHQSDETKCRLMSCVS